MDRTSSPEAAPSASPTALLRPVRPTFRAVARTVVPETQRLDAGEWSELEAIVEDALAQRPPGVQRQLLIFVRLLNILPVFRWGRTFRRLDPDRRARFLHRLQTARLFLFRRGFWGLRTLIYMGYYGRTEAYRAVGYQARLRGWLEHPDAPEDAREAMRGNAAKARDAGPDPTARRESGQDAAGGPG